MFSKLLVLAERPVLFVFLTSLVLSLVAITGKVTVARDAALYLSVAEQINSEGLGVAFKLFNWPWLSMFIAGIHKLTGLSHLTIAYLYTAGFMAGLCALLVSIARYFDEKSIWWAVLLALSIPAFNSFRYDIIREMGFWFFLVLSLWLYVTAATFGWLRSALIQVSIFAAILFRLEALFMLAVFPLHALLFSRGYWRQRLLTVARLTSVTILGILVVAVLVLSTDLLSQPRIVKSIDLINPVRLFSAAQEKADHFGRAALRHWSYDDAILILISGMAIALAVKIFKIGGLATLMLLLPNIRVAARVNAKKYSILLLAAAFYFVILLIFYIQSGFSNSRYSALFLILLTPFFSSILASYFKGKNRLAIVFVIASIMIALANVISTSPKKTHYLEAADWVREYTSQDAKIAYMDARIQYHAGRGFTSPIELNLEKPNARLLQYYQYFVIKSALLEGPLETRVTRHRLKVEKCFSNGRKGKYVCILSKVNVK